MSEHLFLVLFMVSWSPVLVWTYRRAVRRREHFREKTGDPNLTYVESAALDLQDPGTQRLMIGVFVVGMILFAALLVFCAYVALVLIPEQERQSLLFWGFS